MGLHANTTEHVYKIELNGAILLGYVPWRDQSKPYIKYSCFSYEPITRYLEAFIVELGGKNEETLIVEHEI